MTLARIVGTGRYLPKKIWTNDDLAKMMDTTDEWIRQRTGIEQRHIADESEAASDLCIAAARQALDASGVTPQEIDLVICCTVSPDHIFPATASIIQDKLGAKQAAAFDVNAACSGFVYGLATAHAFIRSGVYKTVLLCGGEMVSNRLNWSARDTAVLFGDGAGAMVLRAEDGDRGVLSVYLRSDGGEMETLYMAAGGSRLPLTPENVRGPDFTVKMKGPELFKRAVIEFGDAINKALDANGMTIADIDWFIPHQANLRIIQVVGQRLGLPEEKVVINIQRVGNTTAGSIPIALDEIVREGKVKEGQKILVASFGAGLTWGSAMIRW